MTDTQVFETSDFYFAVSEVMGVIFIGIKKVMNDSLEWKITVIRDIVSFSITSLIFMFIYPIVR